MFSAQIPYSEAERLEELLRYEVLDTGDEQSLDDLTQLASYICDTSISLISLIDKDRQWFKSRVGLSTTETSRDIAFCSHAILQEGIFEVPNALEDERFHDNPLVTGDLGIRFYAGSPLITAKGSAIGTLCVIDKSPKKLTDQQRTALNIIAKQVVSQLELRLHNRKLQRMQKEQETMFGVIAHDLRSPFNAILGLSEILQKESMKINPERLALMAESVLTSSQKVYHLLDELLQWARTSMGATSSNSQQQPMASLLRETLIFMQEGLVEKNITLEQVIINSVITESDPAIIKTLFRNLLANAIKYTPIDGTIAINIEKQDQQVLITVTNSGKHIYSDGHFELFENLVHSSPGISGEFGSGFGLSLCGYFVKNLNGKIWVDRDYTEGTTIKVSLPCL